LPLPAKRSGDTRGDVSVAATSAESAVPAAAAVFNAALVGGRTATAAAKAAVAAISGGLVE
jgi:hypothetical protein